MNHGVQFQQIGGLDAAMFVAIGLVGDAEHIAGLKRDEKTMDA